MSDKPFINARQVAALLAFSGAPAFLRARERLEQDQQFPAPVPTCRRPLKWRRAAVVAWLEQAAPAGPLPPAAPGVVVPFRAASQ